MNVCSPRMPTLSLVAWVPTMGAAIAPVPDAVGEEPTSAWLTLTTCHPKYSAQQRFIVHAELVQSYPRADGIPPSVLTDPTWKA